MGAEFKITQIGAVMLGVRDLAQAVAFYRDTLGLKVKLQESQIAVLEAGPVDLGLSPGYARLAPHITGATEVVFRVESVREAQRTLQQRGVAFLNEPRQVTGTEWAAHFKDKDGHLLSIFGPLGES
jgi:catechol 2,3-dioxygenase-like lactoylglutathione lyase family enzyme